MQADRLVEECVEKLDGAGRIIKSASDTQQK